MGCRPMKNTLSGNEGRGFMKILVASDTDTVVGVHLIGPETAEIIQVSCRHHAEGAMSHPGKRASGQGVRKIGLMWKANQ